MYFFKNYMDIFINNWLDDKNYFLGRQENTLGDLSVLQTRYNVNHLFTALLFTAACSK